MPTDKKITDLPLASVINPTDLSVLVSSDTDYQFAFSTLLSFIGSGLQLGANIAFGGTLPQNTVGKDGDVFINTSAGNFAQKVSGAWTVVYTLPSSGGSTDGTVLYGLGAPGSSTGNNGDTYIDTGTGIFYKKTAGAWAQVFSMQTGPAGPAGASGANGTNGADGKTILNGSSDPSNLYTGADGDFYINTSTSMFFGPKAAGVWPAGISLVGADGAAGAAGPAGPTGATGPAGAAGAAGPGVATGGTSGQILSKHSNTDYDTSWIDPPVTGAAAPDGIITGLVLSISGLDVSVTAGQWRIAGTVYQTASASSLTLSAADPTNDRIDLVYADNTNTIAAVTGTASANPVKPSLPANSIEVGFALVTPSGTTATGAPGADYVTQAAFSDAVGDKTTLTTADKNNLVEAINEVAGNVASLNQDNVILKIFKKTNYS
ncbi:MAG TPA: hypothetical protein VHB54_17965 [Mucilaginibacter sp.]|nr:hypothetical protein [Mucilaginibacter sp.]